MLSKFRCFFLIEANILSSKQKNFCLLLDFWLVLNVFRFISLRFAKNRLLKSLFNRYFFLLALYVKCWRPPYRQLFRKQSKADLFYEINSVPGSKAKNRWLSHCYIKLKSVFFKHICKNVNLNKIIIKELLYAGPMWSYLMYYVINASKSLKFPIQRTLIGGLLTVIYLSQICLNLLWEHLMLHC